jgi:hypothetical protein
MSHPIRRERSHRRRIGALVEEEAATTADLGPLIKRETPAAADLELPCLIRRQPTPADDRIQAFLETTGRLNTGVLRDDLIA